MTLYSSSSSSSSAEGKTLGVGVGVREGRLLGVGVGEGRTLGVGVGVREGRSLGVGVGEGRSLGVGVGNRRSLGDGLRGSVGERSLKVISGSSADAEHQYLIYNILDTLTFLARLDSLDNLRPTTCWCHTLVDSTGQDPCPSCLAVYSMILVECRATDGKVRYSNSCCIQTLSLNVLDRRHDLVDFASINGRECSGRLNRGCSQCVPSPTVTHCRCRRVSAQLEYKIITTTYGCPCYLSGYTFL